MEPAAVLRILMEAHGVRETQVQLARVQAEAKRTADSTRHLEDRFGSLNTKTIGFNQSMMKLRNVVSILKWPALIAGAGGAAQAIGALGTATGSVLSAMGPLSGALAGVAGTYAAVGQAAGVTRLAFADISKAMSGNKKALDALTPSQRRFLDQLKQTRDQVKSLRETAAAGMLPGVGQALRIVAPLFDRLRPAIAATAQAMGGLATAAARMVMAMGPALRRIMDANVGVIRNLGQAAISLGHAFITVLDAARPLTRWFGELIARGAAWVDAQVSAAAASGQLAGFLDRTRQVMTTLGHIIGNLIVGLWNIGKAAAPLGRDLLRNFEQLTRQFRDWTESAQGQNAIAKYFQDARGPVYAVMGLLGDITGALAQLFRPTPQSTGMINDLRKLVGVLSSMFQTTIRTLGPAVLQTLTNLARIFGSIAGTSGPLNILFRVLAKVTGVIADLVQNAPGLSTMVSFMVGLGATYKLMRLLVSPLGAVVANIRLLPKLVGGVGALAGALGGLGGKTRAAMQVAEGQMSLFPATVASSMSRAQGAAKSGIAGLVTRIGGGLKTGLIGVAGAVAIGLGIAIAKALQLTNPSDKGRDWARDFLKGVGAAQRPGRAPAINPLPVPAQSWFNAQAAKWVDMYEGATGKQLRATNWSLGRLVMTQSMSPRDRAAAEKSAAGLANAIVGAFRTQFNQVRFKTTPVFVQDVFSYLDKTPVWARRDAMKMMIQYAAQLEASGKLPKGSMNRLVVALEQRWPQLTAFLRQQSRAGAAAVASNFNMPQARKNMVSTLANIRGQWGLWRNWNRNTNLAAISRNFTSTFNYLKWVITHRTGEARTVAQQQMTQLRNKWAGLLNQVYGNTRLQMSRIEYQIATHTGNARKSAYNNFQGIASAAGAAMSAGTRVTQQGAKLIGEALNQMLRAFGQKPIPIAGMSAKSLVSWSQWWKQGGGGPSAGIGHRARGGLVTRPTIMVGEEAPAHPEYVISSNPRDRSRMVPLLAQAARHLRMPGFQRGGIVTASQYDGVGSASGANAHTTVGFAELSRNYTAPLNQLDFAALGHLPFGTRLRVTYNGRSIVAPKIDVGAGGPGIGGHIRAIDLTMPASRLLNFSGLQNVAVASAGGAPLSLAGGAMGAAIQQIVAPKVQGGGTVGRIAQAALNKIADAANAYVTAHMPTATGGGMMPMFPVPAGPQPIQVRRAIGAANSIVGLPYIYGGGHGSWASPGYDCSGAVSFVLHAAGLLNSPQAGGGFFPGGAAGYVSGPGKWFTIATRGAAVGPTGHVMMEIAGRGFESGGSGGGPHWTSGWDGAFDRYTHPPGWARGGLITAGQFGEQRKAVKQLHGMLTQSGYVPTFMPTDSVRQAGRQINRLGYGMHIDKQLNQMPPYAGAFATGGVVPGPTGAPRTIIAHGGEPIGGPLMVIENMNVRDDFDERALAHKLAWLLDM